MRKLTVLIIWFLTCLLFVRFVNGQESQSFLFTKGDNDISIITMGSPRSPHCTVIEYPEFLVIHEIPTIPINKSKQDSTKSSDKQVNPLLLFIDSIYSNKPIKYILNSHHHSHSLSTIIPFLERGATLITAKENIEVYEKRGLFGQESSLTYSNSIVLISADTILLSETLNPIEVLYLKKEDYKSIPTKTYLFFNFPEKKLLATSCMVYLRDIDEKYGYKGIVYSDRLINVKEIIADKNIEVENTLQLYRFRTENGLRKLPVFSISHFYNVLEHSWHRRALSEYFQNRTYEELISTKDSILNYLIESDIYHIIVNHAVYELIAQKEYKKAVALAHILVLYTPDEIDYIDSLGEAYFNNGQIAMAEYYDEIIQESKEEGLGIAVWKTNQINRLKNGG